MNIYYAHCKNIYNTPQETRDKIMLSRLGFIVYDPNNRAVQNACSVWEDQNTVMQVFEVLIDDCDALAFRRLPDGSIPSGVGYEVLYAIKTGKPVIELPNVFEKDILTVKDTRNYLSYLGQR